MISRSTLVAALVVAELAIIGMAGSAISGAAAPNWSVAHGGRHTVTRHLDKSFVTGPAPHVVVDVDKGDVTVVPGPPGTVAVNGTLTLKGRTSGAAPRLDAIRTADGVRVAAESGLVHVHGKLKRTVVLTLPPDANLDIASAGNVDDAAFRARAAAPPQPPSTTEAGSI